MRPAGASCPLCIETGGELVWQDRRLRVILADDAQYPGFTRVVWQDHVVEFGDLDPAGRAWLVEVLVAVEGVMRRVLEPVKVNLASLGNQVAHLHWHMIPRWPDDAHFPAPVWATPDPARVEAAAHRVARTRERLPQYRRSLREVLDALAGAG